MKAPAGRPSSAAARWSALLAAFSFASVAAPAEPALPPSGLHPRFAIERKMFSSPSGYFQSGAQQKAAAYFEQFHARLAAMQPQVKRERPREAVGVAAGSQTCLLFRPPQENDESLWGIYFHLSPGDEATLPRDYGAVCERRRLLFVSPQAGGNGRGEWLRTTQVLDALATLRATGKIDAKRVFIGGFSGGGFMAFWIHALYPHLFADALDQGRDFPLESRKIAAGSYAAAMPFLTASDWRSLTARPNRWAFLMGTADPNWPLLQETQKQWTRAGLRYRVFSLENHPHQPLPPASLEEALNWIEAVAEPSR